MKGDLFEHAHTEQHIEDAQCGGLCILYKQKAALSLTHQDNKSAS